MNRIAEYASILKREHSRPLADSHPADPLLRSLLVHVAFADGQVDENEFGMLQQLIPGRELGELLVWVDVESKRSMDVEYLMGAFSSPSERQELIDLAELMSAVDGRIDPGETLLVATLKSIMQG